MAILTCESCGRKLRVPDDRGRVKVTCPNCRATWFHPAELVETSEVIVRCAFNGAGSVVEFERRDPNAKFAFIRAQKMETERGRPRAGGVASPASVPTERSADDYFWMGFKCPHCGSGVHVVYCHGHVSCGGTRSTKDGQEWFRCFCGVDGGLTYGTAVSVAQTGGGFRETAPSQQARLTGSKPQTLPPPQRFLPGKGRR
jgi:hypothetical protein